MLGAWALLRRKFLSCSATTLWAYSSRYMLPVYRLLPHMGVNCGAIGPYRELWRKLGGLQVRFTCATCVAYVGLRANAPAAVVLAEVQHVSLQQFWWSRLFYFWNNFGGLHVDFLHHQIALADCRDGVMHDIRIRAHTL